MACFEPLLSCQKCWEFMQHDAFVELQVSWAEQSMLLELVNPAISS